MSKVRIMMVDDHSLFRESLARLLEADPDFVVVGRCATATEAITTYGETPTDVILLDYDLGEEQGSNFLSKLKSHHRDAKILMVTAGMSDAVTLRIMEEGASGVVLKHSSLDQLVTAIHRVMAGELWLDTGAVRALVAGKSEQSEPGQRTRSLTQRQLEVLKGILDGLINKEIASKLGISESSVKAVIQELFHKTGVRTRSQLVRIAIEKHSSDWLNS
jgi:two-component system nitrate/nitrite response regulator NarL